MLKNYSEALQSAGINQLICNDRFDREIFPYFPIVFVKK